MFVEYLELFWVFFKIGLFTIGGGYAMIPMIMREVAMHGWMQEVEVINFIGIAESTPGPFAVNIATFVGFNTLGVGGALLATLGVVLPSFVIIFIISKLFIKFSENTTVQSAFWGIKPVIVALVLSATVIILLRAVFPNFEIKNLIHGGEKNFKSFNYFSLIIVALCFGFSQIKVKSKKIHPVFVVLFAAVLGIIAYGVILK